jgi:hypothetical protein
MIYCNLKGGLANMFFEIAAVKSMAIDKGVDCSFPNITAQLNLVNNDNKYNPIIKHGWEYMEIFNILNTTPPREVLPTFTYPLHYQPIDLPKDNFIVNGFFQSEKYFIHNRAEILEFLKIPDSILKIINEKYSTILRTRTTSLHVRRGDYVRHPNHYHQQTIEYFNEAIDRLKDITDTVVIFSDDIPWCKNNLKYENVVYISDEKDYIEIYLMSLCENNITVNSSFSWWGAWLNQNENKVVIGPKKWFGPALAKYNANDIVPETWIKI